MKKLLSVLASITLVASSVSTVSACSSNTTKTNSSDTKETKELRTQSVDSIKSLILSDQYGLDPYKTSNIVSRDSDSDLSNFNKPDASVTKGLNLDGMLGKDNAPLYKWNEQINKLLSTFNIGPVDLSPYFDAWGGVIKEIPSFINSGNIDGLLGLIPAVINNVMGFTDKIVIDPGSIGWLGDWIKMNIKYVMDEINFNNKIITLIKNAPEGKANMNYIAQKGIGGLVDFTNILFNAYDLTPGYKVNKDNPKQGDNVLSAFLGTKILTPLLNKQPIDKDIAKKIFNPAIILANIKELIDDASTFIASILYQLTVYVPMTVDDKGNQTQRSDPDKLFSSDDTNEKVFGKYDNQTLSVSDDGNVMLVGEQKNISLNDSIYGVIDLISDDKQEDLGIIKLTNILFHDQYDDGGNKTGNGLLLDQIVYWLVDSLKFTNYQVKISTQKNVPVVGNINVNLDFNLMDLFGSKNQIDMVSGFSDAAAKLIIGGLTVKNLKVSLNIKGNGLLDEYSGSLEELISALILGKKITEDILKPIILNILGDKNSSLFVSLSYQYLKISRDHPLGQWVDEDDPASSNGWVKDAGWSAIGGKLVPIFDELLETVYYTDGTKLFDALKGTGFVSDDQLTDIKKSMSSILPLVNKVSDAISSTPIGDLRKYSGLLNLDSFMDVLNILLYTNKIQDSQSNSYSLLEQILMTIGDSKLTAEQKSTNINKYLGYVDEADVSGLDSKSHYAYENGFIGSLVKILYPHLDKDKKNYSNVAISQTKNPDWGDAISLRYVSLVPSLVVDKLKEVMNKVSSELQGDNITDIVDPIADDDKVWITSNVVNKFFANSTDLKYQSYELTLDTTKVSITHRDKDGKIINIPGKKTVYKVTYSRIDSKSAFEFKSIEKVTDDSQE